MNHKLSIFNETFQSPFNADRFIRFIREFFINAKFDVLLEYSEIPIQYKPVIASYQYLAKFTDNDKNNIAFLTVKLQKGKKPEHLRSAQRSFVSKILSEQNCNAAISAFYTEGADYWRFSLVLLEQERIDACNLMAITVPANRCSYLVGEKEPCYMARKRLFPVLRDGRLNLNLKKIEGAFRTEAVTDEFFREYYAKYCELKKFLDNDRLFTAASAEKQFNSEQFAKRLMCQLACLYIIQKKGWLGVKCVPLVLNECRYNIALNCSKKSKETILRVYRYASRDEYRLNTALLASDGFSNYEAHMLAECFTPESWGSGEKNFIRNLFETCTKSNNKCFFKDCLEPLFYEGLGTDKGKTQYYKNLNCRIPFLNGAVFNPLKGYDWKKATFCIPNSMFSNTDAGGVGNASGILDMFERYNFAINGYDPLEREVAVNAEMLGKVFEKMIDQTNRRSKGAYYTPPEIVRYMCVETLIQFIMNMTGIPYDEMKQFVFYGEYMAEYDCCECINLEDDNFRRLPRGVFDKLREIDAALKNITVADPAVGSGAYPLGMLNEIVKIRCIIAEYKIAIIKSDNKKNRCAHYFESHRSYKLKYNTIKNCIYAVDIDESAVDVAKLRLWLSLILDYDLSSYPLPNLDYNIVCGNSVVNELELARYKRSLEGGARQGFLWELEFAKVFKEKSGFDIVIGNPPFINSANMASNMPDIRKVCNKIYRSARGNWDLSVIFIELGYLISAKQGIVSFIISNKIASSDYAKEIRTIMNENSINEIRDYSGIRVFKDADVYPITFVSNKKKANTFVKMVFMDSLDTIKMQREIAIELFCKKENWDSFFLLDSKKVDIIDKMLKNAPLCEVSTVKDAATVSEAYGIKEILRDNVLNEQDKQFMFINTGTIDRYVSRWGQGKARYIKQSYSLPVVEKAELKNMYPVRYEDSKSEKIIIAGIAKVLECYYDSGEYLAGKSTVIVLKSEYSLKYMVGLLNSKLLSIFYRAYFGALSLSGGFIRIGAPQIKQLPLAVGNKLQRERIIELVDEILAFKHADTTADTTSTEAKIDRMVYEIYGLNEEEIKIIDNSVENLKSRRLSTKKVEI